jgi:hypothetical protein
VIDDDENSAKELRYKCRRHNADYYTDSAIPDTRMCGRHSDSARSVLFSPDSSKLASHQTTRHKTIRMWNGMDLHKEELDEEAQAGRLEVREDGEVQEL